MVDIKRGIYSGKPTECSIQGAPRPAAAPWADSPLVPPVSEGGFGEVGLPPTGAVVGRRWFCSAESPCIRPLEYGHLVLTVAIGAIGASMNRVHQPRTLLVLRHNAGMGTAAGADELVEIPAQNSLAES